MLQDGECEKFVSRNKVEQLTIVELTGRGQGTAEEDRANNCAPSSSSPGPGHLKSGAIRMKSAHKLAAALAVLLILIGAAYFVLTGLQSMSNSTLLDIPLPSSPPPQPQPSSTETAATTETGTEITTTTTTTPVTETITSTKTLFPVEASNKAGYLNPVDNAGSEQQQQPAADPIGAQQVPVALATQTSPQMGAILKNSTLVRLIRPGEATAAAVATTTTASITTTTTTTTMSSPVSGAAANIDANTTLPEVTTATSTTTITPPSSSSEATEPAPASPIAAVGQQQPGETLARPTNESPESVSVVQPIDIERLYESATTRRPVDQLEPVELAKWDEFKRMYAKVYPSAEEERRRLEIFAGNLRFITAFNRNGQALFKLDVNKFADLTRNETNLLYIGPLIEWAQAAAGQANNSPPPMRILSDQWVQASDSLRSADWRNLTSDEPVDQGLCRDSSIFAIVASLESTLNAALVTTMPTSVGQTANGFTSPPPQAKIKLSEQQILDCLAYMGPAPSASWPPICSGHLSMVQALDFLQRQGIRLASAPEYAEFKLAQSRGLVAANSCLPPPNQQPGSPEVRPKLGSYDEVHRDNIDEALLNRGPLIVALDASQPTFHFYKSGIYHDLGCSSDAYNLHALLVAFAPATSDGDTNLAHYTIRASLGSAWGELGHMRLLKDASRNKCLPQNLATYPNIAYE